VFFKLGNRNVHHKRNQTIPIGSLSWKLSWLQCLSVKNQISSFSIFQSRTEGPVWNTHGNHIVLILIIRLAGEDGLWWRQKLGIVVSIKTGPAAELLPWQQHNKCHFISCVINISGSSYEEYPFNISKNILYSVFYDFSCQPFDVITFLICIIQKCQYL